MTEIDSLIDDMIEEGSEFDYLDAGEKEDDLASFRARLHKLQADAIRWAVAKVIVTVPAEEYALMRLAAAVESGREVTP